MPPRSVKMKRFIFGFQRRVWWPKWTPASSNCFMETTGMGAPFYGFDCGTPAAPGGSRTSAGHRPPWDLHRVGGTESADRIAGAVTFPAAGLRIGTDVAPHAYPCG